MTQIHLTPTEAWTFARLPRLLADAHIQARTVLHIGAHHGEEVPVYRQCGFTTIRLVEPDPDNLAVLASRFGSDPDIDIIPTAVATTPGTATLHRAARSVWSGLDPHPTATGERITVPTITMAVAQGTENVLVLDTQGTELDLLRTATLDHLDLVIIETTRRPGDGAALYDHTVSYMDSQHWSVTQEWVHDTSGYTDTIFRSTR